PACFTERRVLLANGLAEAYLIVVPVPAYRTSSTEFAVEGAFAAHLQLLREKLGAVGREMVLAAPFLSKSAYESQKSTMTIVNELEDGIRFNGVYPAHIGRLAYFSRLPKILAELTKEVRKAAVVHAGQSPLFRPFEYPALLIAYMLGKITISVTDIDQRQTAYMNFKTGRWSLREYVVTRLLHDTFQHLQLLFAAKYFSLVLIKGLKMASDYGANRPNVKYFLDSAFSGRHLIPEKILTEKISSLRKKDTTVEIVYFGRLVEYKGVDHMLYAVQEALRLNAKIRFHIIGDGPEIGDLKVLSESLGLGNEVVFHGSIPFGDTLFSQLQKFHILMAAPQSEDTPRSALDAMASAQSIVAYDTYYYRELAIAGGPVELVPWRAKEALGQRVAQMVDDRNTLAANLSQAVEFARKNTQERWLDQRIEWTLALVAESK
ncbi:MAG TPA: glycosyltransferase, partial [Burkholderiaceae bacterium]|nr:glycosyltransferase [Burkholderiaceae bacterium]